MDMVVESEEMENADNGNECFMPVSSNEQDEKSFFLLSYSPKEEKQFQKEGLAPLILKAFEHNHINVKHREKELEILFFENKQELYALLTKPQ